MNKNPPEWHGSSQTGTGRPAHVDPDSSEELARVLGGIGTPTESHSLTARMEAAIDDIGGGYG
jgi:hypothetical protein